MPVQPKQKFLLIAPLIVLPFLFAIFYALGGGRGQQNTTATNPIGLNLQLPGAWPNPKQILLNKMKIYAKADLDSARKKESEQRDPYRTDSARKPAIIKAVLKSDPKADELLRQLDRLQQSMRQQPQAPAAVARPYSPPPLPLPRPALTHPADTPESDPQLDRLNSMLDKVIRIQHPGESKQAQSNAISNNAAELLPADSASNAIAAVIPTDQTLVTGGTIALRLAEDARINGWQIPGGQWVYGVVTISSDRLLVHIRSLRNDRNIYNTDLQVYDLDGLPGIHIPGMISRDVVKESTDESLSGLNLATYDPSLGAQAANAGIQAAKTLFSRKVKTVRVSVWAGYQVLLKNSRPVPAPVHLKTDSFCFIGKVSQPPGFVPGGSFLQHCRTEGMELDLQEICLQDSLLWIGLRWTNHSPIGYIPDYCRWLIRDKRFFSRTAQQELPVGPVYSPALVAVGGDSTANQWTGFRPFALAKDKELVLEVGEKGGARTLTLVIDHRKILHAKWVKP